MSETIAIILRFRENQAQDFERLFQTEVLPLWKEFKAQGKFIAASLSPAADGNQAKPGMRDYILHVKVPSRAEHVEFDTHPLFEKFLPKAQAWQPEEPLVWLGKTMFEV